MALGNTFVLPKVLYAIHEYTKEAVLHMNDIDKIRLVKYITSGDNNPSADRSAFKDIVGYFEQKTQVSKLNTDFPVRVLWKITGACNCTCRHCWASLGKPIESSQLIKVAEELSNGHIAMVSLSGGEPLLCPDLFKIYRILKKRNAIVEILTNGSLIDEIWVKKYLEVADTSIDVVQISLDGSTSEIHDSQRNKKIFDQVIYAIKLLKSNKVKVRISMTATHNNEYDVYNTYLLCNSLGVDVMSISPVFPLRKGKMQINNLNESVYLEELLRCKDALNSGKTSTQIRAQVGFGFQEMCLELFAKSMFPAELVSMQVAKCAIMQETNISMQIDAHGNVIPGPEYESQHIAGNVYKNTIREIWTDGVNWDEFRHGRDLEGTKCSQCPIFAVCGGGNAKIAFDRYNTINAPDGRCI